MRHPFAIAFLMSLTLTLAGCGQSATDSGQPTRGQPRAGQSAQTPAEVDADSPLWTPSSDAMNEQAPDQFDVVFTTSRGEFVIAVDRSLSPLGADRFYNLARHGFYDDARFFRVVPNFMVQFGLSGDPKLTQIWRDATIRDDPVKASNTPGMVSFAKTGRPNSRTSQLFINYGNNAMLDRQGFSPIGRVTEGMDVVKSLYSGYGEGAPRGNGPDQMKLMSQGNAYLAESFPKLDYIISAEVITPDQDEQSNIETDAPAGEGAAPEDAASVEDAPADS